MAKYIAKKGDRVLYVGACRSDWHGNPATVFRVAANGHVTLRFDKPHSGSCYEGLGFMLDDLRPYTKGLDVTKPLFIRNCEGLCPATLIGVLKNGDIAVESADTAKVASGYLVYNREGKFVRSGFGGSATTLENQPEPVVTKAYINVGTAMMNGGGSLYRKRTSLGNSSVAQIEVTLTDGCVTGAELVQAGTIPVEVRG